MHRNALYGLIVFFIVFVVGSVYYFPKKSSSEFAQKYSQSSLASLAIPNFSALSREKLSLTEESPSTEMFAENDLIEESDLYGSSFVAETGEVIVRITEKGFEPREVEIQRGTTVIWINESSKASWPASDPHPTHRLYPGSGIEKCGTGAEIFDACRSLQPGEKWSFVFNEVGEWGYHDHLNPTRRGKIIVNR